MCGNGLSSRARVYLLSLLLLAAGAGLLIGQTSESSPELPLDTSLSSSSKESESPDLDALFQSLRDEINLWGTDSEALLNLLQDTLTTSDALSPFWTQLKEQFDDLSENEQAIVLAFTAKLVESEKLRIRVEKERDTWRGIGITSIVIIIVGGVIVIVQ